MTDVEFALLIFGVLFVALFISFLVFMIIFKYHKNKTKILTETEFNEKLSQNKNNYEADKILRDKNKEQN